MFECILFTSSRSLYALRCVSLVSVFRTKSFAPVVPGPIGKQGTLEGIPAKGLMPACWTLSQSLVFWLSMLSYWYTALCFVFYPRIHWAGTSMPPRPWSGSSPSSTCGIGCWSRQRWPPWPSAAPRRWETSPPGPTTTWMSTAVPPRSPWIRVTPHSDPTLPAPNSEGWLGEVSQRVDVFDLGDDLADV